MGLVANNQPYFVNYSHTSQSFKKKKKKKKPRLLKQSPIFYVDVAVVVVVVGFKVFKERNVGNNRLLLSELRHLKNGPAMVFWSMFDLTRAAPANTPRPVAS